MHTHESRPPAAPSSLDGTAVSSVASESSPSRRSHEEQQDSFSRDNDLLPPSDSLDEDMHVQVERPTPSVRTSSSRRARVEDDEDEDERETNRQRTAIPGASGSVDADHQYHPDMHTHSQERAQQVPPPPPPPPAAEGVPPPFGHIAFTVDWIPFTVNVAPLGQGAVPGTVNHAPLFEFNLPPEIMNVPPPPPYTHPAAGQQSEPGNGHSTAAAPGAPGATEERPQEGADILQHLRDVFRGIPIGANGVPGPLPPGVHVHHGFPMFPVGGMFAGMDMNEPDDPGRAKKLLSGLEEVPEGLLKRMERLGEEDRQMATCAVCFDSLLQPIDSQDVLDDSKEYDSSEHSQDLAQSDHVAMNADTDSPASNDPAVSSTASTSGSSTASGLSTETTTQVVDTSLDHKVFVLPCAHAFHGSCLRPWFTRPHRTTCPTCRFDIDPESLTYTAPPPNAHLETLRQTLARAHARARTTNAQATGPVNAQTQTDSNDRSPQGLPQAHPQDHGAHVPAMPTAPQPDVPGAAAPPALGLQPQPHPDVAGRQGTPQFHGPVHIPMGVIFDFSMVIPGPRPPGPPPTHVVAHVHPQAVPTSQPQPPPQFMAHVPNNPPQQGGTFPQGTAQLDAASMHIVQQIMRGMFDALGVSPVPAPSQDPPASPPARAASEPPPSLNARTPSPPPFVAMGGGPLPAFGGAASGTQMPLPSFEELVQIVEGMPPSPMAHPQHPPQPGNQADATGVHQAQPQAPPLNGPLPPRPMFGNMMHNIQNIASNAMHHIFNGSHNVPGFPRHGTPHAGTAQGRPLPPGPIPFTIPLHPRTRASGPPPGPKRDWMPPPPPGPTLRQRIERKERGLGLRCADISCGLGPTDDDPVPAFDPCTVRQIAIKPTTNDGRDRVCDHLFHSACLVSAERVAGWNGADQKKDAEGEENVQVSCPVCRAVGSISREDWEEGACALV